MKVKNCAGNRKPESRQLKEIQNKTTAKLVDLLQLVSLWLCMTHIRNCKSEIFNMTYTANT